MVEHVPNEDMVSRLIYRPRMFGDHSGLTWDVVFEFPKGECESTVWRKYAPERGDVHTIGREIEALIKRRNPHTSYTGFISANVGQVRSIRTARGHGFAVSHEPDEGLHHVEICFSPADGGLQKADRIELKLLLRQTFDEHVSAA